MKYLLCLVAVLQILIGCNQSDKSKAFPKIMFNKDTLDFGLINKGDTCKGGFAFVNGGNASLKFFDVSASCGCTVIKFDSTYEYDKGKEGVIDINLLPITDTGVVIKNIVVKTNSEKQLKVLYVKANVKMH